MILTWMIIKHWTSLAIMMVGTSYLGGIDSPRRTGEARAYISAATSVLRTEAPDKYELFAARFRARLIEAYTALVLDQPEKYTLKQKYTSGGVSTANIPGFLVEKVFLEECASLPPSIVEQINLEIERYKLFSVGPINYIRLSGISEDVHEAEKQLRKSLKSDRAELLGILGSSFTKEVLALPKSTRRKLGRRLGFSPELLDKYYTNSGQAGREIDQLVTVLGGPFSNLENTFSKEQSLVDLLRYIKDEDSRGTASMGYLYYEVGDRDGPTKHDDLKQINSEFGRNSEWGAVLRKLARQDSGLREFGLTEANLAQFGVGRDTSKFPSTFHIVEFNQFKNGELPQRGVSRLSYALKILFGEVRLDIAEVRLELVGDAQIGLLNGNAKDGASLIANLEEALVPEQKMKVFQFVFLNAGPAFFFCSENVRDEFELSQNAANRFYQTVSHEHRDIVNEIRLRVRRSWERSLCDFMDEESIKQMEQNTGLTFEQILESLSRLPLNYHESAAGRFEGFFIDPVNAGSR